MPKYDPKDGEGEGFPPFPRGEFDFSVVDASEKKSKKGHDMIALELSVSIPEATKPRRVFCYLLFMPSMLYFTRHFCEAVGLDFSTGELTSQDCLDVKGRALFCGRDDKPSYGMVEKWIRTASPTNADDDLDSIPF